MSTVRTLVGTPDRDEIRRGRYQGIADSLILPLGLLAQAFAQKKRKDCRGR